MGVPAPSLGGDELLAVDPSSNRKFFGSAAVCDVSGRLLASRGDPSQMIFMRSIAKIARARALIDAGLVVEPSPMLALASGSHTGTEEHLAALTEMASGLRVSIADLQTSFRRRLGSSHLPAARRGDVYRQRLENECSGEHLGALALARWFGDPDYLRSDGIVQSTFRNIIEGFADGAVHFGGRDHCGMPAVRASLASIATGFARLADDVGAWGEVLGQSIVRYPTLYGGHGQYSTSLIVASNGIVIAKGGLGGAYGLWWPGRGVGAAVRVRCGEHAAAAAVLPILAAAAQLPYPEDPPQYYFDDGRRSPLRGIVGRVV